MVRFLIKLNQSRICRRLLLDQLTESSDSEAEINETTDEIFPQNNSPIKLLPVAFDDGKDNSEQILIIASRLFFHTVPFRISI